MTTIPAGLAEYAAERGYDGPPFVIEVAGKGAFHNVEREVLTCSLVQRLAEAGIQRVGVCWGYPAVIAVADFTLHELLPWTGLAGNPKSFPVEID